MATNRTSKGNTSKVNRDVSAFQVKGRGRQGKDAKTVARMATVSGIRKEAGNAFALHMGTDLPGLSLPSVRSLLRTMAKESGESVSVQSTNDPNVLVVTFRAAAKK